ncbi:hypothetical protein, partial [Streptomyces sp. UNOB3_S3]|uniref:hypothetical protein n=1 Tax=Streptomyces sp. UNOB3_S3 TaxID=2871682 RepID=UPI001E5890AE
LTFGTLLSSQGTDASFVLTLSGFPPGFPSVFPTLPDPFSVPFPLLSQSGRSEFRFRRPVGPGSPSLSESFRPIYIGFSVPDKESEWLRVNPMYPIHRPKLDRY